jgi:transcriptional regulator with XRE-family HTH domain
MKHQPTAFPPMSQKDRAFCERVRVGLLRYRKGMRVSLRELTTGIGYKASDFAAVERGDALPSARMLARWLRRLVSLGAVFDRCACRSILVRFRKISARRPAVHSIVKSKSAKPASQAQ